MRRKMIKYFDMLLANQIINLIICCVFAWEDDHVLLFAWEDDHVLLFAWEDDHVLLFRL